MASDAHRPSEGQDPSDRITEELLRRLHDEHNEAAIRALIDRAQPLVVGYVRAQWEKLGVPPDAVPDVIQEVLTCAYCALSRRNDPVRPATPEGWRKFLCSVVHRRGINAANKARTWRRHCATGEGAERRIRAAGNEERLGAGREAPGPAEAVADSDERAWQLARLDAEAGRLTPDERRMIELERAGVPRYEAAREFDLNPGTYLRHWQYLLKKLRRDLNPEGDSA